MDYIINVNYIIICVTLILYYGTTLYIVSKSNLMSTNARIIYTLKGSLLILVPVLNIFILYSIINGIVKVININEDRLN